MKQPKVAFIIAEAFPEPIGSFLLDQIAGVIDKGFDVTIFVIREDTKTENNKEKLERYKIYDKSIFLTIPKGSMARVMRALPIALRHPFKALRLTNRFKYGKIAHTLIPLFVEQAMRTSGKQFDIIHSHFGPMGLVGAIVKDAGIQGKLVTSFHGGDVNGYPLKTNEHVYLPLFARGDAYTANSTFTKKRAMELGCSNEDSVHIIPMMIDSERFKRNPKIHRNQKKNILLTVGRLMEEKGHEYSLRGFAQALREGKYADVEYRIVGDGPMEDHLRAVIKEEKIENKVAFVGRKTGQALLDEYSRADLFILTSIPASYGSGEGQGVAVEEAQAMELPVITSDFAGLPDGIIATKTGLLAPVKDSATIAKHIQFLLDNPAKRIAMGKAGRVFVQDRFGPQRLSNELAELYHSLIG